MRSSLAFRVFVYSAAVFAGVVILAPFVWLLISSVAAPADLLVQPLKWIPAHALSRWTSKPKRGCGVP